MTPQPAPPPSRGDRDDASASAGSRIAVIDKAAMALEALLGHPRGATPTEIAEDLGINRSTVFRLLTSLDHVGLVDRDASNGRYRLGLRLMVFGDAVRETLDLARLADSIMQELRDATRQTVFLSRRDGWGAVCLQRLAGPDVDVLGWKFGQWLPFHIGAAPRALLAALPDTEVDRYLSQSRDRQTRHGFLSDDDIRRIVAETRARSWAINQEDITNGVSSIGVAVTATQTGPPLCALSIAGLAVEFGSDRLDALAEKVKHAGERLAATLTGR